MGYAIDGKLFFLLDMFLVAFFLIMLIGKKSLHLIHEQKSLFG
jgi:hypothetical protein